MSDTKTAHDVPATSAKLETVTADTAVVDRLKTAEQAIRDCLATYDSAPPHPTATDSSAPTGQLELTVVMPCLN